MRLQRLFNWLARVPQAEALGKKLLAIGDNACSWERIGEETARHLRAAGYVDKLEGWTHALARAMRLPVNELPEPVAQHPAYFAFFPEGGVLAAKSVSDGVFDSAHTAGEVLDKLGTLARRHLFHYGLYKIESGRSPIAA